MYYLTFLISINIIFWITLYYPYKLASRVVPQYSDADLKLIDDYRQKRLDPATLFEFEMRLLFDNDLAIYTHLWNREKLENYLALNNS